MSESFRILGIPSTLRRASFNTGLLRAAREIAPHGVAIDIYPIREIPMYDQDEDEERSPSVIRDFRGQIRASDALLLATSEYNHSITGVMKNALDWASRPSKDCVLRHKPVGLISATGGPAGGVRAKLAILPILESVECHLLMRPELMVGNSREKFDADGNLHHEETRAQLATVLAALVAWTRQVRSGD